MVAYAFNPRSGEAEAAGVSVSFTLASAPVFKTNKQANKQPNKQTSQQEVFRGLGMYFTGECWPSL